MIFALLIIIFFSISCLSQDFKKEIGTVTFTSSQMMYVKFRKTENIQINDTIYGLINNQPLGLIRYKSSNSIAANILNSTNINDSVYVFINPILNSKSNPTFDTSSSENYYNLKKIENKKIFSEKNYRGMVSIQSYGYLNNYNKFSRQRLRTNFSTANFLSEKLSLDINAYYNFVNASSRANNDFKNNIKIFQLSFQYKINEEFDLTFGRAINSTIGNIEAVDGFQLQKKNENNTYGLFIGSRPNTINYWFDTRLFQFGLFYKRNDLVGDEILQTTVGVFEQTNKLKSDRRFIYLQHFNSLIPYTTTFLSAEIDFFKVGFNEVKREINLSSFYTSINFKPTRNLFFNVGIDSRKNVYYISEYKNSIDSLLFNNFRNGLKLSTSYSPMNEIRLTVFYNQSQRKADRKQSKNLGGLIYFNSIPVIDCGVNIGYNNYSSSFIIGESYTVYLNKNIFKNLDVILNYRQFSINTSNKTFTENHQLIETGFFLNLLTNYNIYLTLEKNLVRRNQDYISFDISYNF
jgi:hypothetical protein